MANCEGCIHAVVCYKYADACIMKSHSCESYRKDEKRPRGEWIEKCWNDPRFVDYECSVCKRSIMNGRPNFCPSCGASMVKEGEAE